ncbi:MAG: coenzyme F420-0:L-glutamate ligase [Rhodospirillales bacterium]|jgi:coenzyme F420-0:L-glutamate ligase/coenzyme F420-1:gamma-L-glutamate ligase|nr:coenzyme F420-0:L-glutamate ligase [Rhodospirillales bacterium]
MTVTALGGIPEIRPGDDLAAVIADAAAANGEVLADGDIVVVAQKIVSKAEGRYADLARVTPSARAIELAEKTEKDPRLVELILSEAAEVLRFRPGVLIVAHRHGVVLANAGIDTSNLDPARGETEVLLLPEDPDRSAAGLREALARRAGASLGVVVNDSLGRAWRNGTVGAAIGASGVAALLDQRGQPDRTGRALRITEIGLADEIAAAASAVMGQADEGRPVVVVRGLAHASGDGAASDLVRAKELDLFR